jgi:hypothetical protein
MKKSPILFFLGASLLVLAVAGVSFAHWSKIITIDGVIASGDVDWEFASYGTIDVGDDWHCWPGFLFRDGYGYYWQGEKDVASTEVWIDDVDRHILHVRITNGYPCYFTEVTFYPRYTGSVPGKVNHVFFKDQDGNILATLTENDYVAWDWDNNGLCDLEFNYGDNFGAQLHDDRPPPEFSFWIHICEDAEMLHTYEFTIEIYVVNYNEYPVDPQWWIDNMAP